MIVLELLSTIILELIRLTLPMAIAAKSTHTNVITTNFVFSDFLIMIAFLNRENTTEYTFTLDIQPVAS